MGQFGIGVKAIIMDGSRMLLIKRSNRYADSGGIWDIPGGRLNFGEEPEDGLRREVREETGLEIEIKRILDASTIFLDDKTHIVRLTYLCTSTDTVVRLSDEHTEAKWIKPSEIDFELKDRLIGKALGRL